MGDRQEGQKGEKASNETGICRANAGVAEVAGGEHRGQGEEKMSQEESHRNGTLFIFWDTLEFRQIR